MQHKKTTILAILILGGVLYMSAAADEPADPQYESHRGVSLKRVEVAQVERLEESREVRFPGVTRAARRARLAFTVGGRMLARPVEIGDAVAAGQVVARLEVHELKNAVLTAKAALAELTARRAQSERDHERSEQLLAAKATTPEEVEKTSAAVDALTAAESAARARLAETERLLSETALKAPFAGTVTEVHLEPGEHARPGHPVVALSGDGAVEIEVEVPESVLRGVHSGDPVRVNLPIAGLELPGRVTSVGRTAGPGHLFPVVARVEPHPELMPGMTAELILSLASGDGLALPVEAVINPGGRRPAVFRVQDAKTADGEVVLKVEKLPIEVAALRGDRVVVRVAEEGRALKDGDRVVTGGQRGLLEGEQVEVAG